MRNHNRARLTVQKVRDLGTSTRLLLTDGREALAAHKFQKRLDRFLDDAREFDQACWELVNEMKGRLYSFIDSVAGQNRKNASVEHVQKAWKKLSESATEIGHDLQHATEAVRAKTRRTVDAATMTRSRRRGSHRTTRALTGPE